MTKKLKNGVKGTVEKKVEELAEVYEEKKELEELEKDNRTSLDKLTQVRDDDNEKSIRDTAIEEGLDQLFNRENIGMKTELSDPLILHMSRGIIFTKKYKSKAMGNFIEEIMALSVSKARQGRKEYVSLVKSSQDDEMYSEGTDMTAFSKLIGLRK